MAVPRVLEVEVMDTEEEATDYDAMDHGAVNARFCDDVLAARRELNVHGTRFVDIGTGTALIPIALCERDPNVKVVAVDMATHMLDVARRNVSRAKMADRISLQLQDAKGSGLAAGSFDCVVSNSIVHHIPSPAEALGEMLRLVAAGGLLFVRDLVRPESDDEVNSLVRTYAQVPAGLSKAEQARHERQRDLFEASLRASLTLAELGELVASLGIPPSACRKTSDRHWTLSYSKPS